MLDFSLAELLVIAVVALVCIGPKELPGVMRSFGRILRLVRQQALSFMGQLEHLDAPQKPLLPPDTVKTHWIQGDDGKLYESYHPPTSPSPEGEKRTTP